MSSRLGRAWAGTFATSVVIALGGLLTGVLLARYLGPADRGALAAVLLWPNLLVGIGLLSLNEALIYTRQQQPQFDTDRRFNASVVGLALVLAVVTLSLGVPLLPLLLSGREPELVELTVICLLLIVPARFLGLSISGIDRANLHFGRYNLMRLFPPVVYLLAILALVLTGNLTVTSGVIATALVPLIANCFRVLFSWRRLVGRPSVGVMRSLLRTGLRFHPTTLATTACQQTDRILVVMLFPNALVGLYVVALTLVDSAIGLVATSLHTILYPKLSAIADKTERVKACALAMRMTACMVISVALGMAILTPYVLPLLFGQEFAAAVPIAVLLAAGLALRAFNQTGYHLLRAFGEAKIGVQAQLVSLTVFCLIFFLTYSVIGLHALPVALAAGELLALTLLLRRFAAANGGNVFDLLPSRLIHFRELFGLGRRLASQW